MEDGGYVADHMDAFNMLITHLKLVGDKIEDKDCIMLKLLCSFLDSWDHSVMAIRSNTTKFKMDEVGGCCYMKKFK